MTGPEVLALLKGAVDAGLAIAEVIPWAQQQHPELRSAPPPADEEAAIEAEGEAAIDAKFGGPG